MRRRHLAYLVALAERLAEQILLPEAERVLARLDAEHDDVRAALAWAEAAGEARARAAPGAGDDQLLASPAGYLREGRDWLERALGWGEPTPSAERARVLGGIGWLAQFQGDLDRAEAALGEALAWRSRSGRGRRRRRAWNALALVHLDRGHYDEAAAMMDRGAGALPGAGAGADRRHHAPEQCLRAPGADRPRSAATSPARPRYLEEAERRLRALGTPGR